jgi:hypothetical protein
MIERGWANNSTVANALDPLRILLRVDTNTVCFVVVRVMMMMIIRKYRVLYKPRVSSSNQVCLPQECAKHERFIMLRFISCYIRFRLSHRVRQ